MTSREDVAPTEEEGGVLERAMSGMTHSFLSGGGGRYDEEEEDRDDDDTVVSQLNQLRERVRALELEMARLKRLLSGERPKGGRLPVSDVMHPDIHRL